jgi:undecaprenyl-phosphate galactose phosphotransferase
MTKDIDTYSRLVLGFSFIFMTILIPLMKNITKKVLYRMGLWQKKAKIYGKDPFLTKEIYGNPYLGYVRPKEGEEPSTVFINSKDGDVNRLKEVIASQIKNSHEVVFIPLIDDYDMTQSHTYELSNTRTNLVVFKNRLKSYYRLQFKRTTDILISLLSFVILIPVMLLIILKIKTDDPDQPVFYKQKRLGKDKKVFTCYKFRTMQENAEELLEAHLKKHPEEIEHFETYHKYKNDPRVTKIGRVLRNTSMDELPQILNVIRRDMSFIGPRPYMVNEESKIEKEVEMILSVRPGITGLWQVSGRSQTDFKTRIELDKWYIRNWSLWIDIVIFFKTIKVVLQRDGAS